MTVFSGIDIVVDRQLGSNEIRESLASALSVSPAKISVIDDVASYPEQGVADVVCVTTSTSGDFSQVVSIQCGPIEVPLGSVLELVQRISSLSGASLLMPTDGPDPYVMWLVQPSGAPRQIALHHAAFDEDSYVICGSADS